MSLICNRLIRSRTFVVLAAALLGGMLPVALAPADNPQVPSISTINGEWSAKFWQWLLSMPADENPVLDPTGDLAANGQPPGDVFFLCGTFSLDNPAPGVVLGQADRTITVPEGKTFVFPLANNEWDNPTSGTSFTNTELQAIVAAITDQTTTLALSVDGVAVPGATLFDNFRVASPKFGFHLPVGNIVGAAFDDLTVKTAYADGYYVAVGNLAPGTHTIQWYAAVDLTDMFGFIFIQDIKYTIHVQAK